MAASFVVQTIEQEALKQLLKRVENSVDKGTYNDNRQYNGEDHLIGVEFFHEQFELTLMLQKSRMPPIRTRRVIYATRINLLYPTQMRYAEHELRARYIFLR